MGQTIHDGPSRMTDGPHGGGMQVNEGGNNAGRDQMGTGHMQQGQTSNIDTAGRRRMHLQQVETNVDLCTIAQGIMQGYALQGIGNQTGMRIFLDQVLNVRQPRFGSGRR